MILSQFPPEILGLILQQSALFIPLWKCGSYALNASLASGVQDVSLSYIPCIKFDAPRLLSNLRHLMIFRLNAVYSFRKEPIDWSSLLEVLPISVKSLILDSEDFQGAFLLSKLFMDHLPPNLTYLSLHDRTVSPPGMAKLPRSLTHLDTSLRVGSIPGPKTEADLNDLALAPDLIFSKLDVSALDSVELVQRLPPHVLELTASLSYATDLISHMPRSLTKMTLTNTMRAESISEWPPALQSLNITRAPDLAMIAALPRTLTHLQLTMNVPAGSILNPDHFPPRLSSLVLDPVYTTIEIKGRLPSTITSLQCPASGNECLECFSSAFPTTLLHLRVTPPHPNSWQSRRWPLPPNLLTFRVYQWDSNWFATLPRSLTAITVDMLTIPTITPIEFATIFEDLPPKLVELKMMSIGGIKEKFLDPLSFAQFPYLKALILPSALKLTVESLEHLPRSLTLLQAEVHEIAQNPEALQFLPPHLSICSLATNNQLIPVIHEHWPPTAWRCLIRTAAYVKLQQLLERL